MEKQMSKYNKDVEQWARENNKEIVSDSAVYFNQDAIDMSLGFSDQHMKLTLSVLPQQPVSKEQLKTLKKALKKDGMMHYDAEKNRLQYILKNTRKKKFMESLDRAVENFAKELNGLNISSSVNCIYCGKENTNDTVELEQAVVMPVHTACKQEEAGKLLSELEENRYNGNYLLGTIGALLGAFVASIPTIISLAFFDTFFAILYALIPMGAVFGYRLFRGIANNYMRVIAIVMALAVGFVSYVFALYASIYVYDYNALTTVQKIAEGKSVSQSKIDDIINIDDYILLYPYIIEDMQQKGFGDRITPISFMRFAFSEGESIYSVDEYLNTFTGFNFMEYHMGNIMYVLLFTGFGIFASWRYISQTNKKQEQKIKSLLEPKRPL